jgi:hypothetical protein
MRCSKTNVLRAVRPILTQGLWPRGHQKATSRGASASALCFTVTNAAAVELFSGSQGLTNTRTTRARRANRSGKKRVIDDVEKECVGVSHNPLYPCKNYRTCGETGFKHANQLCTGCLEAKDFSGVVHLRMAPLLHKQLSFLANKEQRSLNSQILYLLKGATKKD